MDSWVDLVMLYIRNNAALAPGARAAEWEAAIGLSSDEDSQVSGDSQKNAGRKEKFQGGNHARKKIRGTISRVVHNPFPAG